PYPHIFIVVDEVVWRALVDPEKEGFYREERRRFPGLVRAEQDVDVHLARRELDSLSGKAAETYEVETTYAHGSVFPRLEEGAQVFACMFRERGIVGPEGGAQNRVVHAVPEVRRELRNHIAE